jgi:hypothetical protein
MVVLQIRITLMRIRMLPFNLIRIRILPLTFPLNLDPLLPPLHSDTDPDLTPFHFDPDPEPDSFPKIMRIYRIRNTAVNLVSLYHYGTRLPVEATWFYLVGCIIWRN